MRWFRRFKIVSMVSMAVALLALVVFILAAKYEKAGDGQSESLNQVTENVATLDALLASPAAELGRVDIARMNLLCAQGLPGAERLEIAGSLARVDQMAARVRSETERHFYRFQRNPAEFENSEGFFRMTLLMVVNGSVPGIDNDWGGNQYRPID